MISPIAKNMMLATPDDIKFGDFIPHGDDCCDNPDNHYDDDDQDIICPSCREHACPVRCSECKETVFQSNCCG